MRARELGGRRLTVQIVLTSCLAVPVSITRADISTQLCFTVDSSVAIDAEMLPLTVLPGSTTALPFFLSYKDTRKCAPHPLRSQCLFFGNMFQGPRGIQGPVQEAVPGL